MHALINVLGYLVSLFIILLIVAFVIVNVWNNPKFWLYVKIAIGGVLLWFIGAPLVVWLWNEDYISRQTGKEIAEGAAVIWLYVTLTRIVELLENIRSRLP